MKTSCHFLIKRLLKWLLLLFILLIGPFLFDVHPPDKFSGYGPVFVKTIGFESRVPPALTLRPLRTFKMKSLTVLGTDMSAE